MTEADRHSLAEQLWGNPLYHAMFDQMEADATRACIWAQDDDQRRIAALRVQAIQNLRTDCEATLRSTQTRKNAPA